MTLSIRPVRLNKSVYFRVPNDIADLIGLEDDSQVTLTLEERNDRHLLMYCVLKARQPENGSRPQVYPIAPKNLLIEQSQHSNRPEA